MIHDHQTPNSQEARSANGKRGEKETIHRKGKRTVHREKKPVTVYTPECIPNNDPSLRNSINISSICHTVTSAISSLRNLVSPSLLPDLPALALLVIFSVDPNLDIVLAV
jgi:hypothetical protein